ncbi:MAG: pitrilysin family protein [Prolixibacteraceae bacterium]|jgi:zinc protease|nr:pitrilysin family protein [Prolixibacteraceae bacterium]
MIEFQKRTLANGLRVIVHTDKSTPMAAMNIVYDVGARDEDPEKTGFAHLFEHLMFGGSKHIPEYDTPLQKVGGENNAFTTNDITNYYLTLPAANIETGFWLESDRMLELDFSEKSLEVQRSVVIEEFKQRYLNQPYGDVYPLIKELAYKVHPYKWPTIGKEISHIENATLNDVKKFFFKHYAPNNAVLTVAGNVDADEIFLLAKKWFGGIPKRDVPVRNLPKEPKQTAYQELTVERDVPYDGIYVSFHMDSKMGPDYFTTDLISDILSSGQSSRMYRKLVIEQRLFSELDAYISGDVDYGLFTVAGKLIEGITMEDAEKAIWNELEQIKTVQIDSEELQKVINKVEANLIYSEIGYLNKAMALASFELLGDANLINTQNDLYQQVTSNDLLRVANTIFVRENCSTLYYHKK